MEEEEEEKEEEETPLLRRRGSGGASKGRRGGRHRGQGTAIKEDGEEKVLETLATSPGAGESLTRGHSPLRIPSPARGETFRTRRRRSLRFPTGWQSATSSPSVMTRQKTTLEGRRKRTLAKRRRRRRRRRRPLPRMQEGLGLEVASRTGGIKSPIRRRRRRRRPNLGRTVEVKIHCD